MRFSFCNTFDQGQEIDLSISSPPSHMLPLLITEFGLKSELSTNAHEDFLCGMGDLSFGIMRLRQVDDGTRFGFRMENLLRKAGLW